jgi:hypothetical protein
MFIAALCIWSCTSTKFQDIEQFCDFYLTSLQGYHIDITDGGELKNTQKKWPVAL